MLEAIKEQESVYEELAAKVNEQRDLHTDYMRLIHEQRQLNEDYARDLNTRKLEHDEAVSKINQQMTDFKSAIAAEKETLSAQVKEEYERLQVIKGDIKNAITADSERVKTLAGDEEALSIRIRAFKKREEEFETEKRRFASSSRL
jgi:chromosome segregation ATPase